MSSNIIMHKKYEVRRQCYSGCELQRPMPRLNSINPRAFLREFRRQIMYIVDILSIIPCDWYWLVYGGFPSFIIVIKNWNIDLRHFTKRILQIVPLEKEEQWCDKVTMYSRERNAWRREIVGGRGQDTMQGRQAA